MSKLREYSIADMMLRQDKLNELITPNWKDVRKREEFQTAIVDELAEFLGSGVDYKFWKTTPVEKYNEFNATRIEMVDIIHFVLSLMLLDGYDNEVYLANEYLRNDSYNGTPFILFDNKLDHYAFIRLVQDLFDCEADYVHCLLMIAGSAGMSSEEVSAVYEAKATLNEFRATNGYKEGKYVKVQDGIEDNERLRGIVQKFLNDPSMTLGDVRRLTEQEFFTLKEA